MGHPVVYGTNIYVLKGRPPSSTYTIACFGLTVLRHPQDAVTNIRRGNSCDTVIKMGSQISNNAYGGRISITRGILLPVNCVCHRGACSLDKNKYINANKPRGPNQTASEQ